MTMIETRALSALFHPRSVGVVGVSATAHKLGNVVCANVLKGGYAGPVYAIGSAEGIEGAICVPDLTQIADAPDLLFLAAPAQACVALASQAAEAGVKAVIVGAAGFAESGDEGGALQQQLADLARRTGLMIVGPNCNGIYNAHARLALGFNAGHGRAWPVGGIALLSHSGALFDALARAIGRFGGGLSLFVSAGNEVDLDVLDYMDHALEDDRNKVIALLIDAVPDAARLRTLAARAMALGKPVVALKLGSSAKGADAATAHSSRLAGDHAAHRALFEACGIHMVNTLEGLAATAALLERFGTVAGGLAAISTSGAGASLVADLCQQHDVPLVDYSPATVAALSSRRRFSTLANPTDLGFFGSLDMFGEVMQAIVQDEEVGAFLAFIHSIGPNFRRLSDAWAESIAASGKPHIILAPGGLETEETQAYRAAGALVLQESAVCFAAMSAMFGGTRKAMATIDAVAATPLAIALNPGPLDENSSLSILADHGVRTVPSRRCETVEQAVATAQELGYPVVLKGIVEGVAHKADKGLVALNLMNEAAVIRAYEAMPAPAVLVQPVIRAELEAIIGFTRDPGAGPILVIGLGGVHAETLDQSRPVSLPADRDELERQLDASIVGRVLSGPRWRHPRARGDFIDMLVAVQALALGNEKRIEAIDLNPVMLGAHGAIAVDGLIVGAQMREGIGQ